MFYCEDCAERANVKKHFFRTIGACSVCGEFHIVYDYTKGLPQTAPLFTDPGPPVSWFGSRPRKDQSRAHGHFKWKPRIVRKPKKLAA